MLYLCIKQSNPILNAAKKFHIHVICLPCIMIIIHLNLSGVHSININPYRHTKINRINRQHSTTKNKLNIKTEFHQKSLLTYVSTLWRCHTKTRFYRSIYIKLVLYLFTWVLMVLHVVFLLSHFNPLNHFNVCMSLNVHGLIWK